MLLAHQGFARRFQENTSVERLHLVLKIMVRAIRADKTGPVLPGAFS
jgi:hypothetical protein